MGNDHRHRALLLIGPTGSGKTPLGELLQRDGMNGDTFSHLDFGATLRDAVSNTRDYGMTETEVAFLSDVLHSGALLENETFYIVERLLTRFLQTCGSDYVVLNGLPRHEGQAADVERFFSIEALCCLECSPEIVRQRLLLNTGQDRTNRKDDTAFLVARKLTTFARRTKPLIDRFVAQGATVMTVSVSAHSTPLQIRDALARSWVPLNS